MDFFYFALSVRLVFTLYKTVQLLQGMQSQEKEKEEENWTLNLIWKYPKDVGYLLFLELKQLISRFKLRTCGKEF